MGMEERWGYLWVKSAFKEGPSTKVCCNGPISEISRIFGPKRCSIGTLALGSNDS